MIPAVATLATVLIGTLNGAEMSPKHYILLFFSPQGKLSMKEVLLSDIADTL